MNRRYKHETFTLMANHPSCSQAPENIDLPTSTARKTSPYRHCWMELVACQYRPVDPDERINPARSSDPNSATSGLLLIWPGQNSGYGTLDAIPGNAMDNRVVVMLVVGVLFFSSNPWWDDDWWELICDGRFYCQPSTTLP